MTEIKFRSDIEVNLVKTNASDLDVARAAWVSVHGEDAREKEDGRVEGLINFLWKNQHTSPFEHGQFTFFVKCPIFVAREFMRHRTFSYNEESGRYSVLKPEFYIPGPNRNLIQIGKPGNYEFQKGSENQYFVTDQNMRIVCRNLYKIYESSLSDGIAKEVARMILPVNIFTSFYATVNPLNLMKFLNLRTAEDAQYEIQLVAREMEAHFRETMPITYNIWSECNGK